MFRQESVVRLAFFASIAVPSTAKKIIFVELMQWHGYVSLAQWASIRYAEDAGSIPAGCVATEMWQDHTLVFFVHN